MTSSKIGSSKKSFFDWNENSGLTKSCFNFDVVYDYFNIKYDNEEEKNILAQNGLTFEFYGIYDGGTSYNPDNTIKTDRYKGLFCYWNGLENGQASARFGFGSYGKKLNGIQEDIETMKYQIIHKRVIHGIYVILKQKKFKVIKKYILQYQLTAHKKIINILFMLMGLNYMKET